MRQRPRRRGGARVMLRRALALALVCVSCDRFTARFSTGDIIVAPSFVTVAPGDAVQFRATGCDGSCRFAFDDEHAASGDGASIDAAGNYVAGDNGPVEDVLVVSDRRGESSLARITVTSALAVSPQTASVAPLQTLLIASGGGKPPYSFSMLEAPSGGSVDAITGAYTAGAVGRVLDLVRVQDANGKARDVLVSVTEPLTLSLESPDARPGIANKLVARGGARPYVYSFAPRGNRSHGTVDENTGAYTPGENVLTKDVVRVTDATGLAVDLLVALPNKEVAIGFNFFEQCGKADFALDGRDHFAVLSLTDRKIADVRLQGPPEILTFIDRDVDPSQQEFIGAMALEDITGDQRTDLIVQSNKGWYLFAGAPGGLGPPQTLAFAGVAARFRALNIVAAPAVVSGTSLFSIGTNVGAFSTGPCTSSAANGDGIVFQTTLPGPAPIACVDAIAESGAKHLPLSMLPADFTGDGNTDLALLAGPTGKVVKLTTYGPAFSAPAMTTLSLSEELERAIALPPKATATQWGMLGVRAKTAKVQSYYCTSSACTSLQASAVADLFPGLSYLGGLALIDSSGPRETRAIGWNGTDGRIVAASFGPGTVHVDGVVATFPMQVDCASALDANGDGIEDLAAVNAASPNVVFQLGEGDGSYGRRARYLEIRNPRVFDFDADGVSDVVATDDTGAFVAYFGTDHQLAFAARAPNQAASLDFQLGAFGENGTPAIFAISNASQLFVREVSPTGQIGAERSVTMTGPGVPSAFFRLLPTEIGGAAAGPDFLVRRTDVSDVEWAAIVRDSVTSAHVVALEPLPGGAGTEMQRGDPVSVDLDQSGTDDLVAMIMDRTTPTHKGCVWRLSSQNGGFGSWQGGLDCVDVGGADGFIRTIGASNGRALFLIHYDDGATVATRVLSVSAIAKSVVDLPVEAKIAVVSRLDDDAVDDLAVSFGSTRLTLLRGDGAFGYGTVLQSIDVAPNSVKATAVLSSGAAPALLLNEATQTIVLQRDPQTHLFH